MEARPNLSSPQRRALESAFAFLWAATAFLESIESAALPFDDRLRASNLRESAVLAEQKIIEAFPELLSWLAEWTKKKTTCRDMQGNTGASPTLRQEQARERRAGQAPPLRSGA